jgi:hypothetical protein
MTKQVLTTQTDEEIRAEFDAAAARQRVRLQQAPKVETTETEFLSYSSAGATRKRK